MNDHDATVQVVPNDDPRGATAILTGQIDLATVGDVTQVLLDGVRSQAEITVDLTRVTFIDSSGLALLHRLAMEARQLSHALTVRVVEDSSAHRALALTELDRIIPVSLAR